MQSLWFLWDIFINCIECFLMFTLLKKKLGHTVEKKKYVYIAAIAFAALTTIMNYTETNMRIVMLVMGVIYLLCSVLLFQGNTAIKIMWASAMIAVNIVAGLLVSIIMMNVDLTSMQAAIEPSFGRIIPTTIYIVIFGIITFGLIKLRNIKIDLPKSIQIAVILVSIICILLAGQLQAMSFEPTFSVTEQKLFMAMAFVLSIFIVCYLITIHKTGEYMYSNAEHINQIRSMEIESKNVKQLQTVLSAWNHDQHHHIAILSSYAKNNETDKIQEYLSEMQRDLDAGTAVINTGNQIIDIILSNNFAVCQAEKIRFKVIAKDIGSFPISDTELSSLIGNIMDNAIEACRQCLRKNKEAFIDLRIYRKQQMIFIYEVNSSLGEYVYKNNELISSSDTTGHGYGLKRIKKIVKNANGFVYTEPLKDVFKIELCVPDLDANGG